MTTDPAPWTALYPTDLGPTFPPRADHPSLVAAWRRRVAEGPDRPAVRYFDGSLTAAELDRWSDALAVVLQAHGVRHGDRVAVRLQNVPQYVITMLAVWKAGAAVLLVNPMYRQRELRHLVDDAQACGIVVDEADVPDVREALRDSTVRWTLRTSGLDFQTRADRRIFADDARPAPTDDAGELVALARERLGQRPDPVDVGPDDLALLAYTSGTTGPPKGAMSSHANVLVTAANFARWVDLAPGDVVFGIAPLFHITGAVINAVLALVHDTTLSLAHRFHPEVTLEAFREHGVTFTIGSITAFNALAAHPAASREHFASVRYLYSGGAPIPPATVERFQARFGHYIHNVYGMTETSSAVVAVPRDVAAPVHGPSTTMSIGLPLPGMSARVVDPDGNALPAGEQGELEMHGPSVVAGYWRNADATARTMPGGRLRTGDGAIMDAAGWVYLVDRLKDQINVSGYKVWPREVEDVLYEHPDVHEAAVVGRPDEYRGESVVAFVSLNDSAAVTPSELVAFARERLAAYKCPREIVVIDELPKTLTGKIRRKQLRDEVASESAPSGDALPESGQDRGGDQPG